MQSVTFYLIPLSVFGVHKLQSRRWVMWLSLRCDVHFLSTSLVKSQSKTVSGSLFQDFSCLAAIAPAVFVLNSGRILCSEILLFKPPGEAAYFRVHLVSSGIIVAHPWCMQSCFLCDCASRFCLFSPNVFLLFSIISLFFSPFFFWAVGSCLYKSVSSLTEK